jgi:hypothetical protein
MYLSRHDCCCENTNILVTNFGRFDFCHSKACVHAYSKTLLRARGKIKLTLSRDPPLQGMSLCRCVFVINSNVKGKSIDRNSKFNLIVVLRKTDHK